MENSFVEILTFSLIYIKAKMPTALTISQNTPPPNNASPFVPGER